jgi:hypothetical protein
MTVYISGPSAVSVCGVYAPGKGTSCAYSVPLDGDESLVVSFPGTSGEPIGYYTLAPSGTFSGSYNLTIALEKLF